MKKRISFPWWWLFWWRTLSGSKIMKVVKWELRNFSLCLQDFCDKVSKQGIMNSFLMNQEFVWKVKTFWRRNGKEIEEESEERHKKGREIKISILCSLHYFVTKFFSMLRQLCLQLCNSWRKIFITHTFHLFFFLTSFKK